MAVPAVRTFVPPLLAGRRAGGRARSRAAACLAQQAVEQLWQPPSYAPPRSYVSLPRPVLRTDCACW